MNSLVKRKPARYKLTYLTWAGSYCWDEAATFAQRLFRYRVLDACYGSLRGPRAAPCANESEQLFEMEEVIVSMIIRIFGAAAVAALSTRFLRRNRPISKSGNRQTSNQYMTQAPDAKTMLW